jgi:hypothetical protein
MTSSTNFLQRPYQFHHQQHLQRHQQLQQMYQVKQQQQQQHPPNYRNAAAAAALSSLSSTLMAGHLLHTTQQQTRGQHLGGNSTNSSANHPGVLRGVNHPVGGVGIGTGRIRHPAGIQTDGEYEKLAQETFSGSSSMGGGSGSPCFFKMDPILTPREIFDGLNQYVIGQERVKKILSVGVHNHYKRLRALEMLKAKKKEKQQQQQQQHPKTSSSSSMTKTSDNTSPMAGVGSTTSSSSSSLSSTLSYSNKN